MNWNNPIPRGILPITHESSFLRSPRDEDGIGQAWKGVNSANDNNSRNANVLSQMQRQINRLSRKINATGPMHPFRIFQLGWDLKTYAGIPINYDTEWRTFRVRNGLICTSTVKGGIVSGTDMVDEAYDEVYLSYKNGDPIAQITPSVTTGVQEYVVPDSTIQFWFWVEVASNGLSGILRYGTDPTLTYYHDTDVPSQNWDNSTSPWLGFPAPDGTHFVIGWVDTQSQNSQNIAIVRQLQTTDILSSTGTSLCLYG